MPLMGVLLSKHLLIQKLVLEVILEQQGLKDGFSELALGFLELLF